MYEKVKKVISFYKFINISKLHETRDKVFNNLKYNSILGTVIIANEGINVNISGSENNVNHAKKYIQDLLNLGNIHYNESTVDEMVFTKLKVKIKKEIIKAGFSISEKMASDSTSLEPDEWNKLLDKKPIIIDMRNRFEYLLGTFKNSHSLDLINFSDIKTSLEEAKHLEKDKDIAIFCTGGIRCEKATIALKELGFKQVFQLKGGIINYLNKCEKKDNWKGECFVFDDRITL